MTECIKNQETKKPSLWSKKSKDLLKIIWIEIQKQLPRGVLQNGCPKNFRKTHRKTAVLKSLKVPSLSMVLGQLPRT